MPSVRIIDCPRDRCARMCGSLCDIMCMCVVGGWPGGWVRGCGCMCGGCVRASLRERVRACCVWWWQRQRVCGSVGAGAGLGRVSGRGPRCVGGWPVGGSTRARARVPLSRPRSRPCSLTLLTVSDSVFVSVFVHVCRPPSAALSRGCFLPCFRACPGSDVDLHFRCLVLHVLLVPFLRPAGQQGERGRLRGRYQHHREGAVWHGVPQEVGQLLA